MREEVAIGWKTLQLILKEAKEDCERGSNHCVLSLDYQAVEKALKLINRFKGRPMKTYVLVELPETGKFQMKLINMVSLLELPYTTSF